MEGWSKRKISSRIGTLYRRAWNKLKPRRRHSRLERSARWALAGAILGGAALGCFLFVYSLYLITFVLPDPGELAELNLTESTLIMDREGEVLYAIHDGENRESLGSLDEISPWAIDATLAIEDDQFYSHLGIDIPAIMKAVLSELGLGSARGGSTITQQFVKNTFLSTEQTYSRKFKEILLSFLVELKFSKNEILLMYFNTISYGSNSYGIELAADRFFGKSAADLTLAESAILAGLPQRPTYYSPYGSYRYTSLTFELTEENLDGRSITGEEDLEEDEFLRGLLGQTFELPNGESFYLSGRTDLVLDRMVTLGMITEEAKAEALTELETLEFLPPSESIRAPHFVLWVKEQLNEKYGKEVVEQGGLKVYTTLDPDYQDAAKEALAELKDHNSSTYGANNGAIVSIQPQTGQILAMVGSSDYFDAEIDGQVNMITSLRQPGSSFKPFVYALAFLNQWTPATVLYDVPTNFGTDEPNNYDGQFMGPLSIREALAQSRNITAAKAYFMAGQEEEIVPFIQDFGVQSIQSDGNYGWPLALGTAELTPLELAEAYTVLANTGTYLEPTPFLRIENADGEILEEWKEKDITKVEVLDPQVAFLINDILSDSESGFGPNMHIGSIDNAAKTGTSNKRLSNGNILPNNTWLAAYTPNLVTITWAGNADGSTMNSNATGYSTAAPIWNRFMNKLLDRTSPTDWTRPDGITEVAVSKASGKLPSDDTPSEMIATEVFASFAVPTEVDNSFVTALIETVTDRLATDYSPSDVVEEKTFRVHQSPLADLWPGWQADILAWAEEEDEDQPPTENAEDIHNEDTAENVPEITITSPLSLSAISKSTRVQKVEVDIEERGNGIAKVEFYVDGKLVYTNDDAPYDGNVRISTAARVGQILDITAKAIDVYGYSGTSTIQIRIEDEED